MLTLHAHVAEDWRLHGACPLESLLRSEIVLTPVAVSLRVEVNPAGMEPYTATDFTTVLYPVLLRSSGIGTAASESLRSSRTRASR